MKWVCEEEEEVGKEFVGEKRHWNPSL